MKYLICGLGNIGPEYAKTRHNIGFMVLDKLAKDHSVDFDSDRLVFRAEFKYKGRQIFLIKPTTFMNLSGKALNYWLKELNIPVENSLTITDDIALPFGKLRMRAKGSNGGHNGLGNIQEILGTDVYPRLRFGVGGDFAKGRQVDYVLGNFDSGDAAELPIFIDKSCEAVLSFCTIGLERAMNAVNIK
ncbi:MAG TPA: aminoacyl-tRNA hydrolase [Cytophagaceae bacterium]|jgi:PTH1 family peptidyl-tRNA hydrolase|nr:aminoacyl-tRNA hydrolase [Cytophagaceae bacterium]